MLLGPHDVVTKRCHLGHPVQFLRDFGAGGQVPCTPLLADGVPLCAICLSDVDMLRLMQAGVIIELDN